jgi:dolichol-phosphate mannosyltransferase
MTHVNSLPVFSVVVPVHNEEESVGHLAERLREMLTALGEPFEVVMVDDGSTDESFAVMEDIALKDPRFRVVGLSRNFGHQVALTAGLDLAAGAAVITMDADLQHPPEVVPIMVDRWREGYDVVFGIMRGRKSETRFKRWSSNAFYGLLGKLADIPMEPNAGDFRLVDRAVVEVMRGMPERNRYLRGMFSWVGFRQVGVDYVCAPRQGGHSSYTLGRMVRLGVDAVISFSIIPLRIVLSLGLFASLVAALVGVSTLVARLAGGYTVPGWTTVVLVTTFLGGMQLIVLGLMGEYVGRIYDEVKQRPLYLVSRTVGIHRSGVGQSLPRSQSLGGGVVDPGESQQGGRFPPESATR